MLYTLMIHAKFAQKKTFFGAAISISNVRLLLSITFPQGIRISKNFGHPTLGSGGKNTFKRYLKSEHTDKQTYGHMDIERIGPEGR